MKLDNERLRDRGILVLDYGSQYTLLIARRLREIGVYSEVVNGASSQAPSGFKIDGIILSGGPDSVTALHRRMLPDWVLKSAVPVLGICYGMQLLVESFGGRVRSGHQREYGQAQVTLSTDLTGNTATLFADCPRVMDVWMSHGDSVEDQGGFVTVGTTESQVAAVISHSQLPLFGLQFHPEVHHTESGKNLLAAFVFKICQAQANWRPTDRLEATMNHVQKVVGDGRVLMAVSGGVDSTVAVKLMVNALGADRVTAIFVDNGLLRMNERSQVEASFAELGVTHLVTIDAAERFLTKLSGVSDPEAKRKIIGHQFISEFQSFAKGHLNEFSHLGQGTLYPDVIESAGHGHGSKVIKSHHNVGGLPDDLGFELVEPFRYLFKDEVRTIGIDLGIDPKLVYRHPFPGPGLAVRVLGPVCSEKLAILRQADQIYMNHLVAADWYHKTWQAFAVLLPVKTVGVMGDNRTYQWTCALRAVTAIDGMTAHASLLPIEFLVKVGDDIVRKVDGINRVTYDLSSKPPATIEWE